MPMENQIKDMLLPALCTAAIITCLIQLGWLAFNADPQPTHPPVAISAFAG